MDLMGAYTDTQMAGLPLFLGGMFGNSGDPYKQASKTLEDYMNQAKDIQNPFYTAGTAAIPGYQDWLSTMKDPSAFINNTMSQYNQSPWARYQTDQAMRMSQNMGSATGMTGSTPQMMQAQQNAANISSQDMNTWLQNVLGVNTQYGQGMGHMMGVGQQSANALTNLYGDYGKALSEASYGKAAGDQNDMWNALAGGAMMAGMF